MTTTTTFADRPTDAERRGERVAAASAGTQADRYRLGLGAARTRRAGRSPRSPSLATVGRTAAACRDRAGARDRADGAARGRADWQSGLSQRPGDPGGHDADCAGVRFRRRLGNRCFTAVRPARPCGGLADSSSYKGTDAVID